MCAAHCRLVVRHDGVRSRLPQTLQVPGSCEPEAHGIPRKRYCVLYRCFVYCVLHRCYVYCVLHRCFVYCVLHRCFVYCVLHIVLSRSLTSCIIKSTKEASSTAEGQEFRGTLKVRILFFFSFLYRAIVLDTQIIKPTICTNVFF